MKLKRKNNTRSGPRFLVIDYVIYKLQSSPFFPLNIGFLRSERRNWVRFWRETRESQTTVKADTHEGFCSPRMLQAHFLQRKTTGP